MKNVFIFYGTAGHPGENWFPWLKGELEKKGFRAIIPKFPSPENQTLENWFAVFEKYKKEFTEDTILVGHSLGGTFALRVMEKSQVRIKALFLVAAAIGIPPLKNYETDRPFVEKPFNWEKIRGKCGKIVVFHSDDDPIVFVGNGIEIAKNLDAEFVRSPTGGHFNAKAGYLKFPLLRDRILDMEPA
jgi:predicted alpha/beta hydrolase family esterase